MTDSYWRGQRVCVTGGAGFIGSHLVEALLARGANVYAFMRPGAAGTGRLPQNIAARIQLLPVNLDDERAAGNAFADIRPNALFYLAAHVGGVEYNRAHHGSLYYKNLRPFLSVLEAARIQAVSRILVCSSACVYPADAMNPTPESEGMRGLPEPTNMGYGYAKRAQEYLASSYATEYGMPITIARPFNAYGPRDDFNPRTSHVIPALIRKALRDEVFSVWGTGKATRAFLYVDDFVRGLLAVAERGPIGEAVNIGPTEFVSIRQLAELIKDLAGRPEMPMAFDTTKPEGQMQRSADTTKAEKVLGWRAEVPLAEGLAKTIAWFKEEVAAGRETLA